MNQGVNTAGQPGREDVIEIDLLELASALWSKIHIIIIVGIIFAAAAFAGTKMFIMPTYTAQTKVYVVTKAAGEASVTYNDLMTGAQLAADYGELVKSAPVLDKTIDVLNLNTNVDTLAGMVSVNTADNTRIISISVTAEDAETAQKIANTVREAASVQIENIMAVEAVNTVEEARTPDHPSGPNTKKNAVLGGILGVLIVAAWIIVQQLMDDTIKTQEDVEKYLGLNVLAMIPDVDGKNKKKNKKNKKQRR